MTPGPEFVCGVLCYTLLKRILSTLTMINLLDSMCIVLIRVVCGGESQLLGHYWNTPQHTCWNFEHCLERLQSALVAVLQLLHVPDNCLELGHFKKSKAWLTLQLSQHNNQNYGQYKGSRNIRLWIRHIWNMVKEKKKMSPTDRTRAAQDRFVIHDHELSFLVLLPISLSSVVITWAHEH